MRPGPPSQGWEWIMGGPTYPVRPGPPSQGWEWIMGGPTFKTRLLPFLIIVLIDLIDTQLYLVAGENEMMHHVGGNFSL